MSLKVRLAALLAMGLGFGLFTSSSCIAGGNSGFYIGAGAGQMQGDDDFDDETGLGKVFAGYNFGWLPFLDIGAELSYLNSGELNGKVDDTRATLEIESWQAMGIAGLSFGPLGVYGKAGFADWEGERRGHNLDHDYSGTDPVYGLGARMQLFDVTGRLEVERIDTDDLGNIDSITGSVVYTF
ncbi:outer membrane beta-barrel protein [Halomonas binhaiensis]|uniref:Porin family protein n=1 Tax=Halomonas binhaiensis TaxID=2562282 RepID=A0A5C1NJT4_9GAMM|nr:outer membrane beta-barrel protein [Halomonas binhaiensis]QEM83584.1 porin family protein [Halomonas binhaiensis]